MKCDYCGKKSESNIGEKNMSIKFTRSYKDYCVCKDCLFKAFSLGMINFEAVSKGLEKLKKREKESMIIFNPSIR